jgi:hypothetical protein
MKQQIDLNKVEKAAFFTYFQDGLWDICLGLFMMGIFINELIGDKNDYRLLWLGLPAVLVMLVGKWLVTLPRMGYVEFAPKRKRKIAGLAVLLFVTSLIGLFVYIANTVGGDLPQWLMGIRGKLWVPLVTFFIFSIIAFLLDFRRLVYIGLLFAFVAIPTRSLFPHSIKLLFVTVMMLAPGLYLFVRFLRKYPTPGKEGGNVDVREQG